MKNKFEKSFGGRENYFQCKLQKDLVGDCAIRAVAHATGHDYMDVMRALFSIGLELGRLPNDDMCVEKYLSKNGFVKFSPLKTARGKRYKVRNFPADIDKNYVIRTSGHVTAIIKGRHLDTWDCGDSAAQSYYVKVD